MTTILKPIVYMSHITVVVIHICLSSNQIVINLTKPYRFPYHHIQIYQHAQTVHSHKPI